MLQKKSRVNAVVSALLAVLFPTRVTQAELALNFQPAPSTLVVSSMANQSCNAGSSGGMMMGGMGGMMGFGPGCGSDYFVQEVINTGGTEYYHVILGHASDSFALEYYMRTSGCCWGGGMMMGGMGGMMGGGGPYSSSYGDTNDPFFNAWTPLASDTAKTGSATGNPNRVYMRQITNGTGMTQEFLKAKETQKPRITQTITGGTNMTSTFDLDMSNGNYSAYSNPVTYVNKTTVAGVGTYNAATAPKARIDAGRFKYTPSSNTTFSGAYGTYNYEASSVNVYGVNWLSYCDPSQNPDHSCNFTTGGGMMGGMMGM